MYHLEHLVNTEFEEQDYKLAVEWDKAPLHRRVIDDESLDWLHERKWH